jgi:hypothetical protein
MATTFENVLDPGISNTEGMARTPDREAWIAELAYCKAEIRSFAPGHKLDDWLEAEQELLLNESNNPIVVAAVCDSRVTA